MYIYNTDRHTVLFLKAIIMFHDLYIYALLRMSNTLTLSIFTIIYKIINVLLYYAITYKGLHTMQRFTTIP